MSTKKKKKSFKKSVKTIKANDIFKVHPLASTPYQIYCEYCEPSSVESDSLIVSKKAPLFEVMANEDTYLFFEDFEPINTLSFGDTISVRRVDLTQLELAKRAWWYLYQKFLQTEPINPSLYDAIKISLPKHIESSLFVEGFSIQSVLDHKSIERHHFDYQRGRQTKHPHKLPSFEDLIQQVRLYS